MPDEFHEDRYQDAADGEDDTYDDGMSDPAFEGEADFGSAYSRREKTRRAALRKDNRTIVAGARRAMERDMRRAAKKTAQRDAKRLWDRRIKPLIIGHWEAKFGAAISSALLAAMTSAYFHRFNQLITENIAGATSTGDLVKIPAKSALAAALAVPIGRKRGYTHAQSAELGKQIYQKLSVAEKFIELLINTGVSGEDDDEYLDFFDDDEAYYEDEDEAFLEDVYEDDDFDHDGLYELGARSTSRRHRRRSPSRRDCAKALRQAARHLLRVERRLSAGS